MPSTTIFKKLFEVRILHGYYLDYWFPDMTGLPGLFQEFGSLPPDQNLQFNLLERKYNIAQDLIIEPTPETEKLLNGLKMRWRVLSTGILVGVEVRMEGSGNTTKFFPKYDISNNTKWTFILRVRNPDLYSITNHELRPTLPGRYFFSNLRAQEDQKVFPSLSVKLPEFNNTTTWEMGAVLRDGNEAKAAKRTTTSLSDFIKIADISPDESLNTWHHWAHSGDRLVLPKKFNYRFDDKFNSANPITQVEFSLTDLAGIVQKQISQTFTDVKPAQREFALDFQYFPAPANSANADLMRPKPIPDGWYRLNININGADFENRRILLHSAVTQSNTVFGLIEITQGETQADFQLLNPADGSLQVTEVPGSNPTRWQGPVFEVRLMSRLAFWRYQIEKPDGLPASDTNFGDADFVFKGRHLITQQPRRLSKARQPLKIPVPNDTLFLPSPEYPNLKFDNDNQHYYSELYLSTIKLI